MNIPCFSTVFAYNRCSSDMFSMEKMRDIAQVTSKCFVHSRLKIKGEIIVYGNLMRKRILQPFRN